MGATILLFSPRTTTPGALICLADMVQVFMLNMSYDVQVKLLSFHLVLMALLVLAPDLPRVANLFFLNRPAEPSTEPQLFRTDRANRIALIAQILFGLWLVGLNVQEDWRRWQVEGSAAPKTPLYGIWDVEELSVDGQVRPPLVTDNERWRRVIFDRSPYSDIVFFQRMNDSLNIRRGEPLFTRYGASIDVRAGMLVLTKLGDKNRKANFNFERVSQDQLILDGQIDDHRIHVRLQLFDPNKFPLLLRGFRWIQE